MKNILLVHAHPEPRSFSSALAATAAETLMAQGHHVVVSDLYAMGFDPVSSRASFQTVANPDYFKPQAEELYATAHEGFAPGLETEIRKLEACDLLVFSFPLWWFGLPAILKGWVDRVFAYGRIYGEGRLYERGIGRGKRALALMTTGSPATAYGHLGVHAALEPMLMPLHHGVFWFNGFVPLRPFVTWGAAHISPEARATELELLRARLTDIWTEPGQTFRPAADHQPGTRVDQVPRFLVNVRVKPGVRNAANRSALRRPRISRRCANCGARGNSSARCSRHRALTIGKRRSSCAHLMRRPRRPWCARCPWPTRASSRAGYSTRARKMRCRRTGRLMDEGPWAFPERARHRTRPTPPSQSVDAMYIVDCVRHVSATPADNLPSDASTAPAAAPPRCVIVTGPEKAARLNWLRGELRDADATSPRDALVSVDLGQAELRALAREFPRLAVRQLFLPCLCCPALADISGNVQEIATGSGATRLFIDVPALAAPGLLSEFDAHLTWPRQFVVCLDARWAAARTQGELDPFQFGLLSQADLIVG